MVQQNGTLNAGTKASSHNDAEDPIESSVLKETKDGRSTPSGFVLKLYQMVNEAPEDILSWVPTGEAFRISDLSRLESETLPSFFRHSRFQSLVRQLNFYNFRKINRERTFWVYYHPLFHKDRPQDLHRLRRRTCPGFDGRRSRGQDNGGGDEVVDGVDHHGEHVEHGEDSLYVHEEDMDMDEQEGTMGPMSPAGGAKISRSPSPSASNNSNSSIGHVGKGSVRPSAHIGGLKSVVSEEEKSPVNGTMTRRYVVPTTKSFWHEDIMESKEEYRRCVTRSESGSSLGENNESNSTHGYPLRSCQPSGTGRTLDEPIQGRYIIDEFQSTPLRPSSKEYQLDTSLLSQPTTGKTFEVEKRKYTVWPTSDNGDDESFSSASTDSKKNHVETELRELADVSKELNNICNEYVEQNTVRKRRGRGRPSSKDITHSGSGYVGGHFFGHPVIAFGFNESYDHSTSHRYDMLTYDYEQPSQDDGGSTTKENDIEIRGKETSGSPNSNRPPKMRLKASCNITVPCVDRSIVESISRTCIERMKQNELNSSFDPVVASCVLSFCLSTHPQDPKIASKIICHLKKWPLLAGEFEAYFKALSGNERKTWIHPGSSPWLASLWSIVAKLDSNINAGTPFLLMTSSSVAPTLMDAEVFSPSYTTTLDDLARAWKIFSSNYVHYIVSTVQKRADSTSSFGGTGSRGAQARHTFRLAESAAIQRCAAIWL